VGKVDKPVLLVTGKLAEPLVLKYSAQSAVKTEVRTMPVSVATFLSSEILMNELKGIDPENYSMLLVPGLSRCDLKKIEDALGLPAFKGSKHAADIPLVLSNLGKIELSKDTPADEILKSEILASARKTLEEVETEAKKSLSGPHNFLIGRGESAVAVGKGFPSRVIAEIVDAPTLTEDELIAIAERYLKSGAEIIDIGMIANKEMPGKVPDLISAIKDHFDVPVSIDTLSAKEIRAAIEAGIDLIISISGDTIDEFAGLGIPAVLVPIDRKRGYYPRAAAEKIEYLLELARKANELGYERVIVDPILEPVNQGFVESLTSFFELRKREPNIPLMMGLGNVIELYDADSVGMVALLAGAAGELGVGLLLTVEASDKTSGSVTELRRAREMVTLAKSRGSVPKDLGLDLLFLKEKRRLSDEYDEKVEREVEVIRAKAPVGFGFDSKEAFKIFVHGGEIVALLYRGGKAEAVVKGKTAEEISHEVVRRGLVSDPEHGAYLGRELQKAEVALKTGRGYVQDADVF
jgi:dihydropteroate synthase-like protein